MALANAMRALGTRIKIFLADLKRLSAMIAVAALCSAQGEIVLIFGERQVAGFGAGRREQSL